MLYEAQQQLMVVLKWLDTKWAAACQLETQENSYGVYRPILLDGLVAFSGRNRTNALDRVFAMRRIVQFVDIDALRPDYTARTRDLYQTATLHCPKICMEAGPY